MAAVDATFEFLQWQKSYEEQKPYEIFASLPSFSENSKAKIPRSNLVFEPRTVPVHDVRGREADFSLDAHGFAFLRHVTATADLKDRTAVHEQYVPEMERFLQSHLAAEGGGRDVQTVCFDLRLRESIHPDEFYKKTVNLDDGFDPLLPATHPHIDQSVQGAIRRVKRHMGDKADELLKGRVRVIKYNTVLLPPVPAGSRLPTLAAASGDLWRRSAPGRSPSAMPRPSTPKTW